MRTGARRLGLSVCQVEGPAWDVGNKTSWGALSDFLRLLGGSDGPAWICTGTEAPNRVSHIFASSGGFAFLGSSLQSRRNRK